MVKFSVIIATYNAERTLQRALDSIRRQSLADYEILIADGGSTDQTLRIIEMNKDIVRWYRSEPDRGIFDAWNKCILASKNEWLLFMGADDILCDGSVLFRAGHFLTGQPKDSLIAYGQVRLVTQDGEAAEVLGGCWDPKKFRTVAMTLPHQGVFHQRLLFERYGFFDTSDRSTGTYEMLLRYLKDHDAIFIDGLVVSEMEIGGVSTLPENQMRFYAAYVSAQKLHGTYRPNFELFARRLQARVKLSIFQLFGIRALSVFVDFSRAILGKMPINSYRNRG